MLPVSHDEVVHGKGSLLQKMPGDRWQQFANLRLLIALMFAHPGKKLIFMGGELGALQEWNHDAELDWSLLDDGLHDGLKRLVRDCNRLYRKVPALHGFDAEPPGFEWIDRNAEQSVLAFARKSDRGTREHCIVAINAMPVVRHGYRIGALRTGTYREILNTDSSFYGGSNVGNLGRIETEPVASLGRAQSLSLTLPPLAALVLST